MTRALLASAAILLLAHPSHAQTPNCGPRDAVLAMLATKYHETRRGMGIGANHTLMELFASDTTGTWTVAVSTPDGMMCLVSSGESFEAVKPEPLGMPG